MYKSRCFNNLDCIVLIVCQMFSFEHLCIQIILSKTIYNKITQSFVYFHKHFRSGKYLDGAFDFGKLSLEFGFPRPYSESVGSYGKWTKLDEKFFFICKESENVSRTKFAPRVFIDFENAGALSIPEQTLIVVSFSVHSTTI